MAKNDDILEGMLSTLDSCKESMRNQITNLSEIHEHSNSILLYLENLKAKKTNVDSANNKIMYNYNDRTVQSMADIIGNFKELMEICETNSDVASHIRRWDEFCKENREHFEFLSNGVRKLLAINDTVAQMKESLETAQEGIDSDESNGEDEEVEDGSRYI